MRAIILAAGLGRRLGGEVPKTLLEIHGIPLLERLAGQLQRGGADEIIVTCGYQHALVEKAAERLGLKAVFNPQYADSDNLISLWSAREFLSRRCLVSHGDVIAEEALVEKLLSTSGDAVLPMDRSSMDPEAMKICLDQGRVTDLSKSLPVSQAEGESIPMMVFSGKFLEALKKVMGSSVADGLMNRLLDDAVLEVILSGGFNATILDVTGLKWMEIDTPDDLTKARHLFGEE